MINKDNTMQGRAGRYILQSSGYRAFIPAQLPPVPPEGQLLIYQDGALRVQGRIDGRTVWLTQRLMAELYQI